MITRPDDCLADIEALAGLLRHVLMSQPVDEPLPPDASEGAVMLCSRIQALARTARTGDDQGPDDDGDDGEPMPQTERRAPVLALTRRRAA